MAGGRPDKLTVEVQDQIVRAIEAGNYASVAARAAGVAESTFYRWLDRGKSAKRGKYREFWEAITTANARAETSMVEILRNAAEENPRCLLEILARRFPDRWGRHPLSNRPATPPGLTPEERAELDERMENMD